MTPAAANEPAPSEYPPPGHVIRQLALVVEPRGEGAVSVLLPIRPHLCHPAGGLRTGVLVTAVDVAGGVLTARAVHPDWIATASLSITQRRLAAAGTASVDARVLRAGRGAVVAAYEVTDDDGVVAEGTMEFTRLGRRDGNPDITGGPGTGRAVFAVDAPAGAGTILDHVGVRVAADGAVELDLTDIVRNSLGSVQGGMLGLVAELAAERAGAAALGVTAARTADLALDYVNVAKGGPVRASAAVVRADGDRSVRCRVDVTDAGTERTATVAYATVIPA